MNIYSPPSAYLGQSHTITRIVQNQPSIFHQIELAPCNVDQIMTRQKQRSFVKKAHPQYLMNLIERFLERRTELAEQRETTEWEAIAGRFEELLDEFKDVLCYFRDEVNKNDYPDYLGFVEHEMHMGIIAARLRNGFYVTFKSVRKDLARIVGNALKYNTKDSPIVGYSRFLQSVCEEALKGALSEGQREAFTKRFRELCRVDSHPPAIEVARDPQTKLILKKSKQQMSVRAEARKNSRERGELINKRSSDSGMPFRRPPSARLKRISQKQVEPESDEDLYSPSRLERRSVRTRKRNSKARRAAMAEDKKGRRELINVEEPKREHDGEAILKQIFENKQPKGESRIRTRRRLAFESSQLKSN